MGNRFVAADPGACIGCRTCMAACLSKHDVVDDVAQARLSLVTTLSVSAPIVCHHCVDAPCAAACPTGALYLDAENDRVGVRAERCIGCSGCVMACPYGAVVLATKKTTSRLGNLVIGESERPVVVKCDLCVDRPEGPACIQACPTKGLVLVDTDLLEKTTSERRRDAALASKSFSRIPMNAMLAD